jgi:uncharacterized protein (DUF2267 family)
MTLNFEKYAQTGTAFVKKIAAEIGDPEDTATASRILRSTLHVLRDQSTPEESVQFISQLPMFIKAIYVDGWKLGSNKGRVHQLGDFVAAVGETDSDFSNPESCFLAIQAVFRVIRDYVSEGEIEDLKRTLPEEMRGLLDG